jgi:hypothetical protein
VAAALLSVFTLVRAATPAAGEPAALSRLQQASLDVEVAHPLPTLTAAALRARLAEALRVATPPLATGDRFPDRVVVVLVVRPVSATALRGFWLPFSGTYAIGTVRLGVERTVTLPESGRSVPALVWQTERIVGVAWREADREILRLLDEMTGDLIEARRAAGRP